MDKNNDKKFKHISNRLKLALNDFESIKKSKNLKSDPLINPDIAQKTLIKNIKNLINDLS